MKPPFHITNKIVNLVSSICVELGKIEASNLINPGPKLRKQNRIKTIQATLGIEGNTLTLEQITAVLEGKKVLGPKKEIIEVQNAIKLYEDISSFKFSSVKDFLKAHKILMNTLIVSAGKFRDNNVGILKGSKVSHVAPKPKLVPELIENLFNWGKQEKDLHPLIKSCIIHYEIEFIHPFDDGNGRIGRFWQSVILVNYNLIFSFIPIETLIQKNQEQYYKILEQCDLAGDSTLFIEFLLQITFQSLLESTQSLSGIILDVFGRLEQGKMHFGKKSFSRKDYMAYFKNISSATASRDLKEGLELRILSKSGQGNQTKYKFNL